MKIDVRPSKSNPEAPFANFSNLDSTTDEEKNAPIPNLDANGEALSVSEPSDLSEGAGLPPRPPPTGTLQGLGTVGAAGFAAAAAYHSESETTTDSDTKELLTTEQKKKRNWGGRFIGRKKDNEDDAVNTSLALQEDSSVSSWSRGGDSSPDTTLNLYGSSTQPVDDMPVEMRAFGEDHGLAAAERAMEEEYKERQQQEQQEKEEIGQSDGEGELSQKSSESLRDELDRAIESGDWAAVEKQTNEMLETGDDVDGSGPSPHNMGLSDIDSDMDSEAMEGWSDGNHSGDESEVIDDERIEMLEKLIETDDWQGIVDNSQIHTKGDDSVVNVDENEETKD